MTSVHDVNQCENLSTLMPDFENHVHTSHYSGEKMCNFTTKTSDEILVLSGEKEEFEDYDDLPKQLCTVCLLSFKTEDDLTEHMTKHIENTRHPSILNKNGNVGCS